MFARALVIAATCVFTAWMVACSDDSDNSFVEVRSDRATLLEPFQSYDRLATVQETLNKSGLTWTVIENNESVRKGDKRPPFHVYVLRVDGFKNGGFEGALRMEFFNDRLMATWFYPKDFLAYRNAIENKYPALRADREITVGQHTRVIVGVDHESRNYVAWEDLRLRDDMNRWIKRYA